MKNDIIHSIDEWRNIFDNITDWITIHDKDFNILYANNAAKKILKLPHLNNKSIKCYKYFHGTGYPPDGCPSCNCMKTCQSSVFEVLEPHLKMFLEIRAMPRFDINGKLIGLIHITRDITKRKQLEKMLIKQRDELELHFTERTVELIETNKALVAEIDHRIKTEENLRFTEKELIVHLRELKEANTALKVLLEHREKDKLEFENNILSNVKHLIMPYLTKLKKNRAMSEELAYLNILESNLNDMVSPFSSKLSSDYLGFSPKEIQIADLIRDGKQDKDIAEILNISLETVKTHRKNIRKKLGIYSKRTNLRSYLLSFSK
jgi:DNA-binding CsgD family transcriptional regulator/PAS domain-containing protein